MVTIENLLLFIPTIGLLIMLPGPDFALVSKIALFRGRRHGESAAIGVAAGMCVHTLLAMLGISAILASSAKLYMILKYAGAAYLCYLGVMSITQGLRNHGCSHDLEQDGTGNEDADISRSRSLWAGFLTNVLNPKAILYFMVLYPQFVSTEMPLAGQFLELGLITAFLCAAWYLLLTHMLATVRKLFMRPAFQRWLHKITGAIFIMFGLRLAMEDGD